MKNLNLYAQEYLYRKIGSDCIPFSEINIELDNPILENLNTYETDKLKAKIKKEFPDCIIENPSKNIGSISISRHGLSIYGISPENKKFKHLIEFYGYHISDNGEDWCLIVPIKSDDATEYCRDNYFQFYHFTKKKNKDSILKNGIRCRGEENEYRTFPARVYLYSTINQIDDKMMQIAQEVTGTSLSNISVIKIKMPLNTHIKFYHDDGMPKGAVYCYANIPSKWCKEINI